MSNSKITQDFTRMRRGAARVFCSALLIAGVVACDEPTTGPKAAPKVDVPMAEFKSKRAANGMPLLDHRPEADEELSAQRLARRFALALADDAVRAEVFQAIVDADNRDGKLHLASFLEGRAARLNSRLASTGLTRADLRELLSRVRDLEFYMPVVEHRQQWKGGPDVMIALQLTEAGAITGYTLDGHLVQLKINEVPTTPVLALVVQETRLDRQKKQNLVGQGERPCVPARGKSLAEAMSACDTQVATRATQASAGDRTAGSSPVQAPSGPRLPATPVASRSSTDGEFITFSRIMDREEPWVRGPPELEIHTYSNLGPNGDRALIACSGEKYARIGMDYYGESDDGGPGLFGQYKQNDAFWQGSAKLLDKEVMLSLSEQNQPWEMEVWEDDWPQNGECRIDADNTERLLLVWALALVGHAVGQEIMVHNPPDEEGNTNDRYQFGDLLVMFSRVVLAITPLFIGDGDDFVGVMAPIHTAGYAQQYPDNTHVLMRTRNMNGMGWADYNGRVTLEARGILMPPVTLGPVTQMSLSSGDSVVLASSTTYQLTAFARDSAGHLIPNPSVSWSSSNAGVATVTSTGLVTAAGAGNAIVTGSTNGITASVPIRVAVVGAVTSFVGFPGSFQLDSGLTSPVGNVTGVDANGFTSFSSLYWSTSDPVIADIIDGNVVANGPGRATIRLQMDDHIDSFTVTVIRHTVTKTHYTIGACDSSSGDCPIYGYATDTYFDGSTTTTVAREPVIIGFTIDNTEYYAFAEYFYGQWNPT